eukprot:scaffold3437_cov113-Cylindrotheca_fusiformis.AAC.9
MGRRSLLLLILGLLLLVTAGVLIWHFTGQPDVEDIGEALGNLADNDFADYWDNDPNAGSTSVSDNSTNAWSNDGNGLSLEIMNALDDTWQAEFDTAVSDWDNGDPDTLTLAVLKGEVDPSCSPVDGLMKVCNNNYEEEDWLGINELVIKDEKTIESSVAKMNDYYLRNADYDKRLYTMCHEIGHGFGLPHTDEIFDNVCVPCNEQLGQSVLQWPSNTVLYSYLKQPDLGNCLDYTNNPSLNLRPGQMNFDRLKELYGTVNRRHLRRARSSFSPQFMAKYTQSMIELEQTLRKGRDSTGRRLHEHRAGEYFIRRLDDQYTLKVHVLYPDLN